MNLFLKFILVSSIFLFGGIAATSAQDLVAEKETSTSLEEEKTNPILEAYPWLTEIVSTKEAKDEVISTHEHNGTDFVIIESDGRKVMYAADGKVYCTNSSTLKCEEFYELGNAIDSWTNSRKK